MGIGADKSVRVDLERVRENVRAIRQRTGVEVWPVVKADAYGLGVQRIVPAVAAEAAGFCIFSLSEAAAANLWQRTGKPAIALGPPETLDPEPWIAQHVRPTVTTLKQARALAPADPLVAVDTGMHRFSCPADEVAAVVRAGGCREAFTHATNLEQVERLKKLTAGMGLKRHAAATGLLAEPAAWLDAVRPGLALYEGAVRVSSRLVEVHAAAGPIGYTGFQTPRHGVIVVGYTGGLRRGWCVINGVRRRVLEVGMQSAYVEVGVGERVGDEVVLLGEGLGSRDLAGEWGMTPQEVLVRLGTPSGQ